ncbi:MAG TPA: adenylate/guanylate cyclase domain-containing protein [Anaerolineales bacterium]|nr:adenylate/guanylate cyclase domain-containing protein [Anaerolineales bacterium]
MKTEKPVPSREQLEQAIAAQESLRGTLDDAIIDATVAALHKQLNDLESAPVLEQQRKLVTVLFMDIVNSTSLVHELDPEENLAIMDTALQKLAAPIQSHGGHVTRFMGDGYLAVFGLPLARENDPEMAVRAGLEVLKTAQILARELDKEWNLKGFQVRVGANTGLVVAGGVTEAEGTLMGTAVNLASRLESSAPPGGFLISQYTYQHVRGIFNIEPVQQIPMKGFTEPVQVYLVKSVMPRAFRLMTRGVEGVETRMVGRDQELFTLQNSIESVVQNRECLFVTIVGEAGLGKSRLLYEFEDWLDLQAMNCHLFKGRATLETLRQPYGLLRDLFANRFGIMDDDPILEVREKVLDGFRVALSDGRNWEMYAHFVGHLLGYDFRDSPHLRGALDDPRQLRDRALTYLSNYFKTLAYENPLVIFLDDIHWADESSLDILLHLGRELFDQRVLFVALSRPSLFERRSSWGAEAFHQRLDLHPLSPADSQHLVMEVLQKVQDIPQSLSDLVIQNAEGNPYYLEELIKMLVEDGIIIKREPSWQVRADRLIDVRIPPTLTGVVQARLDSLPPQESTVLQQASVVGKVFWDAVIFYVNKNTPSDQVLGKLGTLDIAQNLEALRNREMIFQGKASAFSDTSEYFFKHAILRDITYESVLKRKRRVYHAIVADWLIAHSGERAGEVTGLIAGHLEKAGKKSEALEYMCRAAHTAASNYAIDEAAEFYARALALAPEDDLERRYTLLLGSEKVFGMQGNRAAQREVLESLTMVADALADDRKRTEVSIRKAMFAFWLSEYSEMLAAAQLAVKLAEAADEINLAGQAYYTWAWALLQLGDVGNASIYAKNALPLARQSGDRRGEGNILNILGLININQGDYHAAYRYLVEFLTIAREIGDRTRELPALNNLGVALASLGNYPEAQDYFQQFLRVSQEIGDQVSVSAALINLAWVDSSQAKWESALKYAEAGITMKKEFKHPEAKAEGLLWLGHIWLGMGLPKEATNAFREALEIQRELHTPHRVVEVLAGLARAASVQGDLPIAQGYVEEILTYLDTGGTLQGTWEPLRIYLTCYQVLKMAEDSRTESILKEALNLLQERANQIPVESDRQRFLENVPWHREILMLGSQGKGWIE